MKAVILAAGLGSRLLPRTHNIPKCLLKIRGHSILEYQISALHQNGVNDIAVVVGHCAEKIRTYLKPPVTFIENKDYATTNSSYSLYLARDFIKNGFIYLNSDLLFHPGMLQTLLQSPHKDSIIIDRAFSTTKDMFKVEMHGERIFCLDKNLDHNLAAAEAVGPAKFSPRGARELIKHITSLVHKGERNQWCYKVFSDIAKYYSFFGVENPRYFWAEIDTRVDLVMARKMLPSSFTDFLSDYQTRT